MSARGFVVVACVVLQGALCSPAASPVAQPAPAGMGVDAHGDPLPAGARVRLGTVRFRHGSTIFRIAASADGKRLATVGLDRHLRLWNAVDGREVRAIPIPQADNVQSLAFSPNSRMLLLADSNPAIFLWDAATGDAIKTFEGLETSVGNAAWSPDGKTIISTDQSDTLRLWDVATGKELRQLKWQPPAKKKPAKDEEDKGIVGLIRWYANKLGELEEENAGGQIAYNASTAAFSPDGKYLTVCGPMIENGQANHQHFRTWEVKTWQPLRSWTVLGVQGQPQLCYSPDGKVIASSDQQESVHLFDAGSGKELRGVGEANATSYAFAPDSKTIAVAGQGNTVQLFDVESGKEQRALVGQPMGQMTLAFLPDGERLAAAGSTNQVQFWDLATGKALSPFEGHTGSILGAVMTPDGKRIITLWRDGSVRVWDSARQVREIAAATFRPGDGRCLAISRDGAASPSPVPCSIHAHAVTNAEIHVFELESGKESLKIPLGEQACGALAFSADGRRLAASVGGGTRIWEVLGGKQIRHLAREVPKNNDDDPMAEDPAEVSGMLAFSPDDRLLLTTNVNIPAALRGGPRGIFEGTERTVVLWEVSSGKKRREFTVENELTEIDDEMAFDARGRRIGLGNMNQGLGACFASRGKHLLLGTGTNIVLVDAGRGTELRRFGGVRVRRFRRLLPDAVLAAGTRDGGICLWDVATATLLCRTPGHRNLVTDLTFSADGQTLTSVAADSTGSSGMWPRCWRAAIGPKGRWPPSAWRRCGRTWANPKASRPRPPCTACRAYPPTRFPSSADNSRRTTRRWIPPTSSALSRTSTAPALMCVKRRRETWNASNAPPSPPCARPSPSRRPPSKCADAWNGCSSDSTLPSPSPTGCANSAPSKCSKKSARPRRRRFSKGWPRARPVSASPARQREPRQLKNNSERGTAEYSMCCRCRPDGSEGVSPYLGSVQRHGGSGAGLVPSARRRCVPQASRDSSRSAHPAGFATICSIASVSGRKHRATGSPCLPCCSGAAVTDT